MSRERSFWAWGYVDELPSAAERERLGQLASAVLKGAHLSPRAAPTLESLTIKESRAPLEALSPAIRSFASTDRADRAMRTYGKSFGDLLRGLDGDYSVAPDVVLTPTSEEDVSAALEWGSANSIAVIPYGGGTSVVAGIEADVGDGFAATACLDMSALGGVRELDDVSLLARIGAGTKGPALESELARHGLTLRFFPQSFEFSTLGGWIATRAGGHFATVETHIDDLVASTRAITPRGVWQTRTLPGSGAGPSPDRLMIGSEGALGVLTEAWMRVRKRPTARARVSIAFDEWSAAIAALRALAQSRLNPANARLLDARETMIHQIHSAPGKHILLLGFESSGHPVGELLAQAVGIVKAHGGNPVGTAEVTNSKGDSVRGGGPGESWRKAFLKTPYLFSALVSLGLVVDTFETAVSWGKFDELHRAVIGAARETMKSARGVGLVSTRVTHIYPDGLAPYYTFITTSERGDELELWSQIKTAVSDAIIANGGTITHHHAVGRVHDPWYRQQRPPLFGDVLAAAKRELDPAGILNPGVLVSGDCVPQTPALGLAAEGVIVTKT